MGTVKYCAGYNRDLLIALATLIQSIFQGPGFIVAAMRALKTVWPSQLKKIITASVLGLESCLKVYDL
jgi:hypothetical protein